MYTVVCRWPTRPNTALFCSFYPQTMLINAHCHCVCRRLALRSSVTFAEPINLFTRYYGCVMRVILCLLFSCGVANMDIRRRMVGTPMNPAVQRTSMSQEPYQQQVHFQQAFTPLKHGQLRKNIQPVQAPGMQTKNSFIVSRTGLFWSMDLGVT